MAHFSTDGSGRLLFHSRFEEWLKNPAFWPLIEKWAQSKAVDFPKLMQPVLRSMGCGTILDLLNDEAFPKAALFTADNLVPLAHCFTDPRRDPRALNDILPANPLESAHFKYFQWTTGAIHVFIERGLTENSYKMRWSSWVPDLKNALHGAQQSEASSKYWHLVSFSALKSLSSAATKLIVEWMNPNSMLTDIFTDSSESSLEVKSEIIGRTLSLFSFCNYFDVREPWAKASISALTRIITVAKGTKEMERLPGEFHEFLELIVGEKDSENSFDQSLTQLLLKLSTMVTEALNVRAVWLLNVIYTWIKWTGAPAKDLQTSLFPLLELFFAPERFATVEDVCALMRLLNTEAQHAYLKPDLADVVSSEFLARLPEPFKEALFDECPAELPFSFTFQLPAQQRFQSILRKNRVVVHPNIRDPNLRLHAFDSQSIVVNLCRDILMVMNNPLVDSASLLAANQDILISSEYYRIYPLKSAVASFIENIASITNWFAQSGVDENQRPILVPSLTLPVQMLEAIGFLIGRAVLYGLSFPFVFDFNYLNAVSSENPLQYAKEYIDQAYEYDEVDKNPALFAAFISTNWHYKQVVDKMSIQGEFICDDDQEAYFLFLAESEEEKHQLLEFYQYKKENGLDRTDLGRLMITGLERFYAGLNEAIPKDHFTIEELYAILFSKR